MNRAIVPGDGGGGIFVKMPNFSLRKQRPAFFHRSGGGGTVEHDIIIIIIIIIY